jgi:hypothetical protein
MSALLSLTEELIAAGIPIWGVKEGPPPSIDYKPEATPLQQADGNARLAAFVWTEAAELLRQAAKQKAEAQAIMDAGEDAVKRVIRALGAVVYAQDKAIAEALNGIRAGVWAVLTNAQKTTATANGFPAASLTIRTGPEFTAFVKTKITDNA